MLTLRETVPFAAVEAAVGLLASLAAVMAYQRSAPLVAIVFFLLSIMGFSLAVHMVNEAKR